MIETRFSPVRIDQNACCFNASIPSHQTRRADAPLIGLAGSDLAARFRHWRGVSGRRYLFSIFSVDRDAGVEGCPRYPDAVALAVSRSREGVREIVWAGQTGPLPDLLFDGEVMRRAVTRGANEIHMHLLTRDRADRDAMIRDLDV